MYDPTMRVLTVLELLQEQERVSGAQLAARLEVHPRTVQRYIARLQDLGVPVTAVRGVGGAYRLKPGFRLPPMMFSGDEALALLLGLRALSELGLSAFAPAMDGARAKLGRVLPLALAQRARQIGETLELDTPWSAPASAPLTMTLAAAVHAGQVLRLSYCGKDTQPTVREVEPYSVLRDAGRWYLLGHCRLRAALRCFRVDRIAGAEPLDQTFSAPADFDARTALHLALASEPSLIRVEVWLGLPPQAVRQGLASLRPHLSEEGGGTLLRCGVEHLPALAALLLGLECRMIIHSPPELRAAFGELSGRAAQIAANIQG
ncbi:helix-turn-helix transcriptional regulator [Deinococcus sp.]|uniref:helix-turn-helix transcriptional regulator n=1 Tax=Deinococcus sp. TaxID=47478 RepID=UPI003CC51075